MVKSYSRYDDICAEASSSESDCSPKGPRTEEGRLKAFTILHERREALDSTVLGKLGRVLPPTAESHFWPSLSTCALEYDDICVRFFSLDGGEHESSLRSVGHRMEVSSCRLGAARALQAIGCSERARERSTQAIAATNIEKSEPSPIHDALAVNTLLKTRIDALLLRATSQLSCGNFHCAHKDALDAHALCLNRSCVADFAKRREESLNMALRCEVALHGGGPGEDGKGIPMSPEDGYAFELDGCLSNLDTEICCTEYSNHTGDVLDLQSMDWRKACLLDTWWFKSTTSEASAYFKNSHSTGFPGDRVFENSGGSKFILCECFWNFLAVGRMESDVPRRVFVCFPAFARRLFWVFLQLSCQVAVSRLMLRISDLIAKQLEGHAQERTWGCSHCSKLSHDWLHVVLLFFSIFLVTYSFLLVCRWGYCLFVWVNVWSSSFARQRRDPTRKLGHCV